MREAPETGGGALRSTSPRGVTLSVSSAAATLCGVLMTHQAVQILVTEQLGTAGSGGEQRCDRTASHCAGAPHLVSLPWGPCQLQSPGTRHLGAIFKGGSMGVPGQAGPAEAWKVAGGV